MRLRDFLVIGALAGVLGLPAGAVAAPPGNDSSATPTALTSGGQLFSGTLVDATDADPDDIGLGSDERNVWYSWTAPSAGLFTVDVCGTRNGVEQPRMRAFKAVTEPVTADLRATDCPAQLTSSGVGIGAALTFRASGPGDAFLFAVGDSAGATPSAAGAFNGRIYKGPIATSSLVGGGIGSLRLVGSALFTGEANSSCRVDGGPFAPCSGSSLPTDDLAEGPHTPEAVATVDGTTDPTPATRSFVVDRTAPDTQLTNVDTSDPTSPQLTAGATEGGSSFECSVDGSVFRYCPSPTGDAFQGLCAGTRTFQVRAVDANGNRDPSPASTTVTTPTGTCSDPQPAIVTAATGLGAVKFDVDPNGHVVEGWVEYGTTAAFGLRTPKFRFGKNLTPAELVDGSANEVALHGTPGATYQYRGVARTSTGLVYTTATSMVTLDAAGGAAPTITREAAVVTPTTVALPYTATTTTSSTEGSAVILLGLDAPFGDLVDVNFLSSDGAAHSGTLRVSGLQPDTDYALAILTVGGTGSRDAEPFTVRTAKVPDPPGPTPAPTATPGPVPTATPTPPPATLPLIQTVLGKLTLPKASLKTLRASKWKPRVVCSGKCSLRVRLKSGRTIVASGTAKRTTRGTSTVTVKPTKAGKARLKKVKKGRRIKLALTVEALDPSGRKVLATLKRSLTFK